MTGTEDIRVKLQNAGQEHLLQFWSDLTSQEQDSLITQIDAIDLQAINTYFTYVINLP